MFMGDELQAIGCVDETFNRMSIEAFRARSMFPRLPH